MKPIKLRRVAPVGWSPVRVYLHSKILEMTASDYPASPQGAELRRLRQARGIGLRVAAQRLGLRASEVTGLETGRLHPVAPGDWAVLRERLHPVAPAEMTRRELAVHLQRAGALRELCLAQLGGARIDGALGPTPPADLPSAARVRWRVARMSTEEKSEHLLRMLETLSEE